MTRKTTQNKSTTKSTKGKFRMQFKEMLISSYLWFIANLVPDPEDFMGLGYKSPELRKNAAKVASIVFWASFVDLLTNQSLMELFVAGLPRPFQTLLGFGVNFSLLAITNHFASLATKQTAKTRKLAKVAVTAFIGLSIVRSLCAPLGTEIFLNSDGIAATHAKNLVAEQAHKIEELRTNKEIETLTKKIAELDEKLKNRQDPNWDKYQIEVEGRYGTDPSCDLPVEKRPYRTHLKCLTQAVESRYQGKRQDFENKRIGLGNDLLFLEKYMPEVYALNFTPERQLRSGIETARIAMQHLGGRILQFDLMGLSLPLIAFLISAITSYGACASSIKLGLSSDAMLSYNEALARALNAKIAEIQQLHLLKQSILAKNGSKGA
ncbi:hypothetical protein ACN4EG_06120 [Alkalinema pantanalense CENA528]|uniref:hypothetical protein n=1 Tax=Alkalinema pantanalense TaxID=1620705 RepID=UPI003D6FE07A